jgi:hypothetical protein
MKIRPLGAQLFHVEEQMDGQRDMPKPIVACRNFANVPQEPIDGYCPPESY